MLLEMGWSSVLLLCLACLALMLWGLTLWSTTWTKAEILELDKKITTVQINGKTKYTASVKYQYVYLNTTYTSTRFSLLGSRLFDQLDGIERLLTKKRAYICPLYPKLAFLYVEKRHIYLWILLAAFSLLVALLIEKVK